MNLLDAAKSVPHSHKGFGHGQEGNPFYAWWHDCRFACDLCLAIMVAEGADIALEFTNALPWRINRRLVRDSEAAWWKNAMLKIFEYIHDDDDRAWPRGRLAEALYRGREAAS